MTSSFDLSAVLAQAQPRAHRLGLCLRSDLLTALDAAEDALAVATADDTARPTQVAKARQAVTAARTAVADATVEIEFRGLSYAAYRRLESDHPSTDDDRAHDPTTFQPALVRACLAHYPTQQVDQLLDAVSAGQFLRLVEAAQIASLSRDDVPLPSGG